MNRQKLKQRLVRYGSTYLLVVAALAVYFCAVCKSSRVLDADATISDLTVTATLPAKAERLICVGSLLDIRVEPDGETPYCIRLPIDSVGVSDQVLTAIAHLDSSEVAGLDIPDSLRVVINTRSLTIFQYWFGD